MRSGVVFGSIFVFILKGILSVPHEFCLEPFDDDDCEEAPTPVFYYYKPGSRCEIKMWRGCPTLNRFPNEFICSHYCIGRLNENFDESEEVDSFIEKEAAKNEWVEELETLNIKDIEAIDQIVDRTHVKLSLMKVKKVPEEDSPVEHEEVTTETPADAVDDHVTEPVATQEHQSNEEKGEAEEVITT